MTRGFIDSLNIAAYSSADTPNTRCIPYYIAVFTSGTLPGVAVGVVPVLRPAGVHGFGKAAVFSAFVVVDS